MTSGPTGGADRARAGSTPLAYAISIALILAIDVVNILSIWHDQRFRQPAIPAWEPACWELTSGIGMILACWIVPAALKRWPPAVTRADAWLRIVLGHGLASVAFSLLHVGVMSGLRVVIYHALGLDYVPKLDNVPYEYRKDALSYLILAGIFWFFALAPSRSSAEPAPGGTDLFDISDGNRLLRVSVDEILAAQAAGNYVEFWLANGARPLMRSTLAKVDGGLAPFGFMRTHRSWIVNGRHVRQLERVGSGDYRITLSDGSSAPLSRRFGEAIDRLKAGPRAR